MSALPFHSFYGQEILFTSQSCCLSWGWKCRWRDVWIVTWASWKWVKENLSCSLHMILNCLCFERFKFNINLLNKSTCACLDVGCHFWCLGRLWEGIFICKRRSMVTKGALSFLMILISLCLWSSYFIPLNWFATCSLPLMNKLDTRVYICKVVLKFEKCTDTIIYAEVLNESF